MTAQQRATLDQYYFVNGVDLKSIEQKLKFWNSDGDHYFSKALDDEGKLAMFELIYINNRFPEQAEY